ncbi:pirin family protein [Flavobacteriaceae bacterium]|jgi:redox-sensitive bicupin YhaK (pirin superfamily)|nr:pirin family protein [Flavobacteriaceae bacterium]
MSIIIYNKDEQASGNFNNGNILEKKPIGFPQDGGQLRPYSNLFYWADAWTPNSKSTIGLHPHQGFEICSFVIKGSIKHFDSKQNEWIELNRGDAQIIRSGSGISHAEEILDNSEMFQIWFDPNISKTISKPASYSDYKADSFPIIKNEKITVITIKGKNSPFEMETEGIEIYDNTFHGDTHKINLDDQKIYSLFIKKGVLSYSGVDLEQGTFIKIEKESEFNFKSDSGLELFEIRSPLRPSYPTYFERFN